MRTTGAIPAPSCSFQEYLEYGTSCASISMSGVILGGANSGARISGLGASLNGYGGNDILPQVGRNTFRYPGAVNLDVRFSKRTRISVRMSFELMGEAFNVLNHPNFDQPIGDVSNPQFGLITRSVGPPTSIFGSFLGGDSSPRALQIRGQLTF